jgi:hypothetical protein
MKLDRNITNPPRGKYALIKLRIAQPQALDLHRIYKSIETEALDFGDTEDSDFFVIRLKDKYAGPALEAYARAALEDDPEYSQEILHLAEKARNHPNKRKPD